MTKRNLSAVVISDTHLGTYGCHAKELLQYLKSINPKILILNGDIIDIWNFKKNYFPNKHKKVLREILKMSEEGTQVYYLTGNHDELFRRYSGMRLGNICIDDKLVIDLNGNKTWIFHGDIFDASTKGTARILAKLGGKGYDLLILLNRSINNILHFFGKERISFSKRVKASVKKAVKWISNFEQIAAELAIEQNYDTVICGHIHQPQSTLITNANGSVHYLNSGDWVENCTALEYNFNAWTLFSFFDDAHMFEEEDDDEELTKKYKKEKLQKFR